MTGMGTTAWPRTSSDGADAESALNASWHLNSRAERNGWWTMMRLTEEQGFGLCSITLESLMISDLFCLQIGWNLQTLLRYTRMDSHDYQLVAE